MEFQNKLAAKSESFTSSKWFSYFSSLSGVMCDVQCKFEDVMNVTHHVSFVKSVDEAVCVLLLKAASECSLRVCVCVVSFPCAAAEG